MSSYNCCIYSQTPKATLMFEESAYIHRYTDTTRTDTLILNFQWDFRDVNISKADSLGLSRILSNLCLQNKHLTQVIYWDFELDEFSEWLYKQRGKALFKFIQSCGCFEQINMIVHYEISKVSDDSDMQYPYNQSVRTIMIIVDE